MAKTPDTNVRPGERIAKVMARAGLCSRRDAESWIAEGRVSVNGEILTSPAFNVNDDDDVRVDGQRLGTPERTRLFFFHKPRGLVTTSRDPEGRPTIFEALPPDLPRVVSIGRLDINTEGLLLLTNDGGLARVLELPATGWLRRYRVRAHGEVQQPQLDALATGITIEGIVYAGIQAKLEREQGSNVWLTMGLREGKNREIKRVLEHLGLAVNRLIRVSFGPFELGDLPEGEIAEVPTRVLQDQLGVKLAKQAGVNFDAPLVPRRPVPVEAPVAPPSRGERPVRRPGKPMEDRSAIAAELATRGERKETTTPKKRKHISILRAEERAEAAGPRRRIERSATADRKGREVKIERIQLAKPAAAAPERTSRRRRPEGEAAEFRPRREEFGDRPARAPREGAEGRPPRKFGEGAGRPPRAGAEGRPPRKFEDRPARAPREGAASEGRAPRRFEGGDARPPRKFEDRPARPPREGAEGRPPRKFEDRPARAPREGAASAGRPPRRFEGGEGRPPRKFGEGSARPPRAGVEGRPPRKFEDRPARAPREGAASEGRPPRRFEGGEGRPPRKFEDRPARPPREGGEGRPARAFGDRPARAPREGGADGRPPRKFGSGAGRPPRGDGPPRGDKPYRAGPKPGGRPGGGKRPPRKS